MDIRKTSTTIWIWAALALILVIAAAARGLISRGHPASTTGAARTSAAVPMTEDLAGTPSHGGTVSESRTFAPGPVPSPSAQEPTPTRPITTPTSRSRSPLERSPGYYPPDDPESLSVITGRREARAVDLELSGGATSDMDLAWMLLAGLNARDAAALHALRVTQKEFEVIFWPEFPESRPVTRITADDAWDMANSQSLSGANRAIDGFGGRELEPLRVEGAPPTPYRNFVLHRDIRLVVRDRDTGATERLKFAPSFVERHGRYKVLMFKD